MTFSRTKTHQDGDVSFETKKLCRRYTPSLAPLAGAIALALGTTSAMAAPPAFSGAWFAAKGAVQNTARTTGKPPNGMPTSGLTSAQQQSAAARQRLEHSLGNLGRTAQLIATRQAAQAAAREAALNSSSHIPDGLTDGGLKIDTNELTAGWRNAKTPTQTVADGKTTVAIQQTADKAVLNWETFNIGRNTTVDFQQQSIWSVLNRVNDPAARPSESPRLSRRLPLLRECEP